MAGGSDAGDEARTVDAHVAGLAAVQFGVFSRAQAAFVGATRDVLRRRVGAGRWERVERDIFRLPGNPPSWRQSLMVSCLAWGLGAVVSHRAAAALWRLLGFGPGPIELTVPRNRRRTAPGTVHQSSLPPEDVTTMEGIPVTTPARTLIDLASVAERDRVEEALDDALRRRLVSLPRLRWCLDRTARSGRPGVGVTRALIEVRDPATSVPQSVFETRLLRLLKDAGLPRPELQHQVRDGGRLIAVVDFAYPEVRLAIEADGYRWHSGRARWEHDRARRNDLTLLGWRVIHVTWTDLTRRPQAVIDSIRNALRAGAPPGSA